ncbi:hypothetical protein MRX96_030202 [Rhipicephalus microplus]
MSPRRGQYGGPRHLLPRLWLARDAAAGTSPADSRWGASGTCRSTGESRVPVAAAIESGHHRGTVARSCTLLHMPALESSGGSLLSRYPLGRRSLWEPRRWSYRLIFPCCTV